MLRIIVSNNSIFNEYSSPSRADLKNLNSSVKSGPNYIQRGSTASNLWPFKIKHKRVHFRREGSEEGRIPELAALSFGPFDLLLVPWPRHLRSCVTSLHAPKRCKLTSPAGATRPGVPRATLSILGNQCSFAATPTEVCVAQQCGREQRILVEGGNLGKNRALWERTECFRRKWRQVGGPSTAVLRERKENCQLAQRLVGAPRGLWEETENCG